MDTRRGNMITRYNNKITYIDNPVTRNVIIGNGYCVQSTLTDPRREIKSCMIEDNQGEYVKFEDVKEIINKQQLKKERLKDLICEVIIEDFKKDGILYRLIKREK